MLDYTIVVAAVVTVTPVEEGGERNTYIDLALVAFLLAEIIVWLINIGLILKTRELLKEHIPDD